MIYIQVNIAMNADMPVNFHTHVRTHARTHTIVATWYPIFYNIRFKYGGEKMITYMNQTPSGKGNKMYFGRQFRS